MYTVLRYLARGEVLIRLCVTWQWPNCFLLLLCAILIEYCPQTYPSLPTNNHYPYPQAYSQLFNVAHCLYACPLMPHMILHTRKELN